jgi:hypothetical protein
MAVIKEWARQQRHAIKKIQPLTGKKQQDPVIR